MRRLLPLVLLMPMGCSDRSLCSEKVVQVTHDLSEDRYATVNLRNCGATTDLATVIRVGRSGSPPEEATEVFVADSNSGAATHYYSDGGGVWRSVVWTAPGKLSIAYATDARVFKRVAAARNATITFRKSEPASAPTVNVMSPSG